jgi:hypothetical protein
VESVTVWRCPPPVLADGLIGVLRPWGLRITAFHCEADDASFAVRWSRTRGEAPGALTDATLAELCDRLPLIADGAWAILTETWVSYEPVAALSLEPLSLRNAIATTPRFAAQLCWNSENDGGPSPETCRSLSAGTSRSTMAGRRGASRPPRIVQPPRPTASLSRAVMMARWSWPP